MEPRRTEQMSRKRHKPEEIVAKLRQVMGQQPVPELGLGFGDRLVRPRQLLKIDETVRQGIMVVLHGADLEHVQDDLGVLRVVLVPAVGERLARPGEGERRDQSHLDTGFQQPMRQRPVVVPVRLRLTLEAGENRTFILAERFDEPVVLSPRVEDGQPSAPRSSGLLDQNLVAVLRDIDCYQQGSVWRKLRGGHGRSPLRWLLAKSP
jgi:hypothetical protein